MMSWDGFPARKWQGLPPEFWVGGVAYVVLRNALTAFELSTGMAWVLTLASLLPLILIVRGVVRQILHQDELARRIELEATAYATAALIVLSFTLSLLEAQSVIPHVRSDWAAVAIVLSRAIAISVLKRRYG